MLFWKKRVVNLRRQEGGQLKSVKGGQFIRFLHITEAESEKIIADNFNRLLKKIKPDASMP